jgi:hypothetical protein
MEIFVLEADIYNYPCDHTYVLSIHKTYEGAVKALNECGPQKWTEQESKEKGFRYFKPDFVPNDNKNAPLESACIRTEELLE